MCSKVDAAAVINALFKAQYSAGYLETQDAVTAVLRVLGVTAPLEPLPMELAPKDGTMLRLLVDYSGEDGFGALEDAETAWTIGFNQLLDTGDDVWEFAGWDWCGDYFTQGGGKVLGWLPFHRELVAKP